MKLSIFLTLTCLLLQANISFSQGMYFRSSSNKMFPNQKNNVNFNKIEIGGYFEFGDSERHKIGVMGGIQCYFINTWRYKFIVPVLCTYTYYFRDEAPSFFSKTGVGLSIPGLRAPDYDVLTFSGFSAMTEIGYRFRQLELNPHQKFYFSIALGFDVQQARTVKIYSSSDKHPVFMGPSVSMRIGAADAF